MYVSIRRSFWITGQLLVEIVSDAFIIPFSPHLLT